MTPTLNAWERAAWWLRARIFFMPLDNAANKCVRLSMRAIPMGSDGTKQREVLYRRAQLCDLNGAFQRTIDRCADAL